METTFRLGIDHTLYIGTGRDNPFQVPGEVRLRVDRNPTYDRPTPDPDAKPIEGSGTMVTFGLRKSEARAIASALLSAATEA